MYGRLGRLARLVRNRMLRRWGKWRALGWSATRIRGSGLSPLVNSVKWGRWEQALVGDGTYLTIGEAVQRLNAEPHPVPIGDQTLRRMVERGLMPAMRIGIRRDRRLPAAAVDELK